MSGMVSQEPTRASRSSTGSGPASCGASLTVHRVPQPTGAAGGDRTPRARPVRTTRAAGHADRAGRERPADQRSLRYRVSQGTHATTPATAVTGLHPRQGHRHGHLRPSRDGASRRPPARSSHVAASNPAPHGWTSYRVRPGDTLIGIAARYRTTVGTLAARNDDPRPAHASWPAPCSACRAPRRPPTKAVAVRRGVAGLRRAQRRHAQRHRRATTTCRSPSLLKANHLSARSFIHPGQRIVVRGAASTAAARPQPRHEHRLPGARRRHPGLDRRCGTTPRSPRSPAPARSPAGR